MTEVGWIYNETVQEYSICVCESQRWAQSLACNHWLPREVTSPCITDFLLRMLWQVLNGQKTHKRWALAGIYIYIYTNTHTVWRLFSVLPALLIMVLPAWNVVRPYGQKTYMRWVLAGTHAHTLQSPCMRLDNKARSPHAYICKKITSIGMWKIP